MSIIIPVSNVANFAVSIVTFDSMVAFVSTVLLITDIFVLREVQAEEFPAHNPFAIMVYTYSVLMIVTMCMRMNLISFV